MKRILTIVCAIAISLLSASAQEKQHSLEITTGYPSIVHNLEYPWADSTVEMTWNGQTCSLVLFTTKLPAKSLTNLVLAHVSQMDR